MTRAQINRFVETKVYPILETGDPAWDKPHAQAAAYHMEQILESQKKPELDPVVMILAAYMHDLGYSAYYKPGGSLTKEEYMQAKKGHMIDGVRIAQELLEREDLTQIQKDKILHLIEIHDNLKELEIVEELVLMEADSLAGLDVDFVKPTFTEEENQKFIESSRRNRFSKFITKYSKNKFEELVNKRMLYYEKTMKKVSILNT